MSITLLPSLRRTGWAALGAGALILLSACTAGGAQPGDANPGEAQPSHNAEIKSGTFEQEMAKWQADLSACMKSKGVDLPTPPPAKEGEAQTLTEIDPSQVDVEALSKANRECMKTIGQPPVNPNEPKPEEMQKMQLIFAKCMRDAGYDFPDPAPAPEGGNAGMAGAAPIRPGDYDEKTMEACGTKAGFTKKGSN
ncbi:hypothetical protein M2390_000453 [Mycetocola sp. BIGb0189]|uniref:hypothetical protein n=1 Tax=Mycetocola sp. BIGb0189 TaxID=2940604 RepID=UPI002167EDE6|nr:hypothetical protein [Mycetocola sp. BIGb0189]MCS4275295.1 hypothetical protein [Mycetocola sp. BIGb0189]